MKFVILLLSLLIYFIHEGSAQKIAIIGCGIGGSSQAYYLANSLKQAEIHIFDSNKFCGGRIKNIKNTMAMAYFYVCDLAVLKVGFLFLAFPVSDV